MDPITRFAIGLGLSMLSLGLVIGNEIGQANASLECMAVLEEVNERLLLAAGNARALEQAMGPWFEHYPSEQWLRDMVLPETQP